MTTWVVKDDERSVMYSPVGLKLIDDFTGTAPTPFRVVPRLTGPARGNASVELLRVDGTDLVATGIRPVLTPSTVLAYPALGRDKTPTITPPTDYEVRIDCDWYRPLYRATATGVRFTAFPYDDDTPPASFPSAPDELRLLPGPAYPHPAGVAMLRGKVVDATAAPVVDALVSATVAVGALTRTERTLSGDGGSYALPLRWAATATVVTVTADHTPPGGPNRTGSTSVTIPDDLATGRTITVS